MFYCSYVREVNDFFNCNVLDRGLENHHTEYIHIVYEAKLTVKFGVNRYISLNCVGGSLFRADYKLL